MQAEEVEHVVVRQRLGDPVLAPFGALPAPQRVDDGLLGRVDRGFTRPTTTFTPGNAGMLDRYGREAHGGGIDPNSGTVSGTRVRPHRLWRLERLREYERSVGMNNPSDLNRRAFPTSEAFGGPTGIPGPTLWDPPF
jgi:hypothetical protein